MPEHQASSSSEPPPDLTSDANSPSDRGASPLPTGTAKRTYLSLLPPSQLIDLILTIDANRNTLIFPHDLHAAIQALRQPQGPPAVKEETAPTTIARAPSAQGTGSETPPPVKPPQYKPPPHFYPTNHTPYYPPQLQPPRPSPGPVPPPSAPRRNPPFTSAPLNRDPNKLLPPHPPPPAPVSSRDDPNAMPSYEEMLVEAILDVGEPDGTAPKVLFTWMASHYPLQQNFRPSASQALHKALKRGRLEKIGGKYRLNPTWGGGPTTSKRATRRPTAGGVLSPHAHPPQHPNTITHPLAQPPMGAPPYPHGQPPFQPQYGFPQYPHHHPPIPYPPHAVMPPATMEHGGAENENMAGRNDGGAEESKDAVIWTDEIRHSLLQLAEAFRKIAAHSDAG